MIPPTSNDVLATLHPGLQRWVESTTWRGLSEIQRAAIPIILDGNDCLVEAPTAGGKTEAVLFPCLTRATEGSGESVRILYLAPLRALLNNLEGRGELYASACGLTAFKWHGDVAFREKLTALQKPPDLLLTTPESLEAILLRRENWQQLFVHLQSIVVDEAHNFAAGDRGGHLLSLLQRVERAVAPSLDKPQRIALSATIGNPEAMASWISGANRRPARRVQISGRLQGSERRDVEVCLFDKNADDERTPGQERGEFRRFLAVRDLLPGSRSIIFVSSRKRAENLAAAFVKTRHLAPSARPINIRTHHSSVSRFFREEAEQLIQLRSVKGLDAIISTSTLELGIDIGALDRVIQMGVLASPGAFLQRIGRTGRRQGGLHFFRGFCVTSGEVALLTAAVQLGLEGQTEALLLPRRAFHLMAHQLLCLALQHFGVRPSLAWETLGPAYCFSGISRQEFDALVENMVRESYLRTIDEHLVVGDRAESEFLAANWRRLFAVFDSAPLYEVHNGREAVGTLDAGFVEALEVPFHFVLGGKLWRADGVDAKAHVVRARPSSDGAAPAWHSFGGPGVPLETAQAVGRMLHGGDVPAFVSEKGRKALCSLQLEASDRRWRPGEIVIDATSAGSASILTYGGDRINRTLARYLTALSLGNAHATYKEVNVKNGPQGAGVLLTKLKHALGSLREQPVREAQAALMAMLEESQPLSLFSAFAKCLPRGLWASALVEQTLDCSGLLHLLGQSARE